MSGKTNILIVGSKLEDGREVTQGSKYVKAKGLGTKIMTEDEFEAYLREKFDNPHFMIENYKNWQDKTPVIKPVQIVQPVVA